VPAWLRRDRRQILEQKGGSGSMFGPCESSLASAVEASDLKDIGGKTPLDARNGRRREVISLLTGQV